MLTLGPAIELPDDAVTQTFGIIGRRGSGKTHTASVEAEELIGAGLPTVIIDPLGVWYGLRSSADGKREGLPVTILGGVHGDAPLQDTAGALVADLVIEQPGAYVVDLSGFETKSSERRFAIDFAERLYRAAAARPRATHVIVDEADIFAPQRVASGDERLLGAFETIARRGRARGLGLTVITQRPAVLNKNVLSQVEVMIAHQLTAPQDREALKAWAEGHATREEVAAFIESLAGLQVGEAWLWSPSWLQVFQRVSIRRRRTFDSSATPKAGETRIEPQVLAPVDLEALRTKMAAAIEKAEADDPRRLRRRIRELETEVSDLQKAESRVANISVSRETEELLSGLRAELEAERRENDRIYETFARRREELADQVSSLILGLNWAQEENDASQTPATPAARPAGDASDASAGGRARGAVEDAPGARRRADHRPADAGDDRDVRRLGALSARARSGGLAARERGPGADGSRGPLEGLRAGARRIVAELVRRAPATWTRPQLGALTRFSHRGGTFQTYLGELKRAGLVIEENGAVGASQLAVELLGDDSEPPRTHADLMAMWREALRAGNYRILEAVVEAGPDGTTREQLADAVEMTASGGTFQTYLGILRRNGLVEVHGGRVIATEVLWP